MTMCLLTLIPTANKDGKIQQENQLTSNEDGSKDLQIQQFSNIEESKECEYSSTLQYKAEPPLKIEMIRNETMFTYPISDQRRWMILKGKQMEYVISERLAEVEREFEILKAEIRERFKRDTEFEYVISERLAEVEREFEILKAERRKRFRIDTVLEYVISEGLAEVERLFGILKVEREFEILKAEFQERIRKVERRQWETVTDEQKRFERIILEVLEIKEQEKELKEYISWMFLMVLLFLVIKNIGGNIKCRQTSCRKYPCLNSILFLLWQSGDVEANPGPPKSISYRNWLYDVCSVVRKLIVGVSTDCKMKKIWQQPPENWPSEELYFDPRNSNRSVNEVENFLQILFQYCDDISKLPHEIISEIDTWNSHKSKDNCQLLNMYTSRVCCRLVEQNVKLLRSLLSGNEVLKFEVDTGIQVILSRIPTIDEQFPAQKIYRAEATRKIASYLCRIVHGKDPEEKCDRIWTKKPDGWPSNCRYYNPNNGGKRCAKNEDAILVEALITLCEQKSFILPKLYQDMVDAWRTDDQTLLSNLITRHTAETDFKKAVMKLHEEALLQDSKVDKHLKELGLLVQCNGSIQNAKSQKRKMVNTMNKHDTKRTKQSDYEDAVNTALKELLPDCSIGQLLDNQSDSSLLDKISQHIPDFLEDAADDIQFHWNQ